MGTHRRADEWARPFLLVALTFLGSTVVRAQSLHAARMSAVEPVGSAFSELEPLVSDSLALVALYNATDGHNWRRSAGWLSSRLSAGEWENVEIRNGRVVALALGANNVSGHLPGAIGDLTALQNLSLDGNELKGSVPSEITNLKNLKGLFLADNELVALPNLERLTGLLVADVSQNQLSFTDLAPNRRLAEVLRYDAQKEFGSPAHVTVEAGSPINLHVPLRSPHPDDRYVWYRGGEIVCFDDQLRIVSATAQDAGTYVLEVTNALVPNLALRSHPVSVEVADFADGSGGQAISPAGSLRFSGDLQFRAEMDRSFATGDGSELPDQDRMLVRLGIGFDHDLSSRIRIGGRVRTRSSTLPRSHIILGDDVDRGELSVHRAFAAYAWENGEFWIGKSEFPFWTQTEVLWDLDSTPEGVSASHSVSLTPGIQASGTFAYFLLGAAGDVSLNDMTRLAGAQAMVWTSGRPVSLRAGIALFDYSHNPSREDVRLGDRNYHIGSINLELKLDYLVPVSVGTDVLYNFQDYPSKVSNRDARSAWTLKATAGDVRNGGDWMLAYTFSRVEEFAVAGGYSWEDRIRSTDQPYYATNFSGHEVYAAADIGYRSNIGIRVMTTRPLERRSEAISPAEGTRIQLEWSILF
ncbi:MAG: putative porin [Rhodothermia bacterium]|nr:putative porin [Rhodothermia bacterium]